jgi:hypothetical protein
MTNRSELAGGEQREYRVHRAAVAIKDIALGVLYTLEPIFNKNCDPLQEPSAKWKAKHDPAVAFPLAAPTETAAGVLSELPSPRSTEVEMPRVVASGE